MPRRVTHRLVDQLFDPLCVPSRTVGDMKRDNVVRAGFKYVIRAISLQVTLECPLVTACSVELRSITNFSPLVEVRLAGIRIIETFQHDKPGKSLDTSNRTLENLVVVSEVRNRNINNIYRWINFLAP
jgi:hypothetical protein